MLVWSLKSICVPIATFFLQQSETVQMSLTTFTGQLSSHPLKCKLLAAKFKLIMKPKQSEVSLQALTVFTDGSSHTHKSLMFWWDANFNLLDSDITTVSGSPQIAELAAVVQAFQQFSTPFNLITDSAYVARIVEKAEAAVLRDVPNKTLFYRLQQLVSLLDSR